MKTRIASVIGCLCAGAFILPILAEKPAPVQARVISSSQPVVTDRGPHHRTVQIVVQVQHPDGKITARTNSWMELATGMHWKQNPEDVQWRETQESIEIVNGVGIARTGPHKAVFAGNINSRGGG